MKIRERGRNVQLIRTSDDGGSGKSTNDVLGSLRKSDLVLPEELASKLTAEERAEFDAYAARQERAAAIVGESAVLAFPETIERVSDWLSKADPVEAEAFAQSIRRPLGKLKKQLAQHTPAKASRTDDAA